MIPGVSSVLSSSSALSGRHLLLLASVAGLGATVFWRVAVNKPVRVLRRSGYRERATPCPYRIFKPERTDGEAHPRLARRARGRRAESARPSSAI